ncbi:MAG: HAD family hydrolase, partial [Mycobacteriales bacterium]
MSGRWRLVVCDLDGTLVTGTTALAHLGSRLRHPAAVEDVEGRLGRGEISDREVAEAYARGYEGLALTEAAQAMSDIPCLDDVADGVALLRRRSVQACIATVSWGFAAGALAYRWGFSQVCGAELDVDGAGRFTGRVARHVTPEDKVAFAADRCRALGIGMEQVVAVGDSRSDL